MKSNNTTCNKGEGVSSPPPTEMALGSESNACYDTIAEMEDTKPRGNDETMVSETAVDLLAPRPSSTAGKEVDVELGMPRTAEKCQKERDPIMKYAAKPANANNAKAPERTKPKRPDTAIIAKAPAPTERAVVERRVPTMAVDPLVGKSLAARSADHARPGSQGLAALDDVQAMPTEAPRQPSRPGAFSIIQPGQQPPALRSVSSGVLSSHASRTPAPIEVADRAPMPPDSRLAQATPVLDYLDAISLGGESGLVEAEEIDLEKKAQRRKEQQRHRRIGMAVLWLGFFLAVVLAASVGIKKSKKNDQGGLAVESSRPYSAPSSLVVPTPAPTGSLDLLLENLPNYTLASLQSIETPQWKAYDWLSRHPDLDDIPEWRKTQLFALATFYYSFEGEHWHSAIQERWLDYSKDECLFFSSGFGSIIHGEYYVHDPDSPWKVDSCNDRGEFTSLYLDWFDMAGLSPALPPEISLLTSLSRLSLFACSTKGSLQAAMPPELFEMTQLSWLSLNLKPDTPTEVPTELGLLTNLEALFLAQNSLTGLPSQLGLLTSLQRLDLFQNPLAASIPSELGRLTNLERLDLFDAMLTGTLPSSMGRLTFMETLLLHTNSLTGGLPTELGLLQRLQKMDLKNNSFKGTIPAQLRGLIHLESLQLGFNTLSGTIPALPSSLTLLSLQDNALVGQLPSELWSMPGLKHLSLAKNSLTGTIPTHLASLPLLERLFLSHNGFRGTIPTELAGLSLSHLHLQGNRLQGALPDLSPVVDELRLDGNIFSGTVPSNLCDRLGCNCSLPWVSTCKELDAPPSWPGRIPATKDAVTLNIQSDSAPTETEWSWQQQTLNGTDAWTTVAEGGLHRMDYLHSYELPLRPGYTYELTISDSSANGLIYGGWVTLTNGDGTILWSLSSGQAFSELNLQVAIALDGSVDVEEKQSRCTTELLLALGDAVVCPCSS